MRQSARTLIALISLLITPLLIVGASYASEPLFLSQEEQGWLREHTAPLRVHNEMEWKPYNYNEDGVPKGYSIDYMNLLAQKLGIQVQYVSGPTWEQFLGMIQAGSLDVMLNIANTRDRRKYLKFTDPYHITSVGLYVHNSEDSITDLDDLNGKRLGFTEGFFFGEFIRRYYPEIKVVTFDSTQGSFIGVQKGLVDAAMDVPLVARSILRDLNMTDLKYVGKVSDPVFITTFSIATRLDNVILNDILQKAIDAVTSEEMRAINEKWALKENQVTELSPADVDHLKAFGPLRLCVHPDRLPLEAVNLDASLTGVSAEFVELLAQRLDMQIVLVPTQSWQQSLAFAKERKCDVLPMISKTSDARESLNFTSPWLSLDLVVATRDDQIYITDISQLADKKIAVVSGQSAKEDLLSIYPDLHLMEVGTVSDGLAAVSNGDAFALIDTLATISRALKTGDTDNVKVSGTLDVKTNFAIGVQSDDGQLLKILEHISTTIDPAEINAIYNRWLSVAYVERVDYARFWQAVLIFSVLMAYVYYRYRKSLQAANELRIAHGEVEAANRKLDRLARTDPLTGLANRLETDDVLHRESARFERDKSVFSIIMIDIDHFKAINDQHGHAMGDQTLKHVADIFTRTTREIDLVGRWGGEEFLVVCTSTNVEGAIKLAEHLRTAIEQNTPRTFPPCTASFGVAAIQAGESVDDLMRRADNALYRAKANGRNRVERAL